MFCHLFFLLICRAKTYRGFSSWVAVLMTHECFVVFGNRWYSYRFYERKLILKISSSLQGTQQNSLLTSFNVRHSLLYLEQFKFRRCRWISHNAIVSLRSYQNQFVMRINHNMFVIFAKAEQHAERYIKLKYPSRVIRLFTVWSNIGFGNPTFSIMCEVTWIWCTALHKTSHSNVSIAIDLCTLSSYRISSNMNAMQLHPSVGYWSAFSLT